jgi:hypothetical protein
MKPYKLTLIGLATACLMACGTPSLAPQLQQAKPDPAWTEPVAEPQPQGRDNAALAAWVQALRSALAEANANLAAIRRWSEGL